MLRVYRARVFIIVYRFIGLGCIGKCRVYMVISGWGICIGEYRTEVYKFRVLSSSL